MKEIQKIETPLLPEIIQSLKIGDNILLSGTVYAARDSAHKRLIEAIDKGEDLPFNLEGQVIYYVGPTPPRPGYPIGSAGPTTSGRMDTFTPKLLELGLKGMIGKGSRSEEVKLALKKFQAVYFVATGGAGALLAQSVKSSEVIAYEDLGTEAIRKLEVLDLPLIVANDIYGGDIYESNIQKYKF